MKNNFKITGYYYEEQGYQFRKYLNIKKVNSNKIAPDLMVVMMNPGASVPIDKNYDGRKETPAKPDKTQEQIMRIMDILHFEYAKILNLSDIIESNSNEFYKKIVELDRKGIAHSIFDKGRTNDFNSLFQLYTPVIYGWGVNNNLKNLALKAMSACKPNHAAGVLKSNSNWAYYHPLPRVYKKQQEWVEKTSDELLISLFAESPFYPRNN